MTTKKNFDAIIIGGGHNGLITAGYLQKAGLDTLVLEARHTVGGACVTEEVFPGYKVSTTSYVCSLLRPKIIRDLELEKHGLEFIKRDPSSFSVYDDDRYLMFWADQQKTCEEIAKFSKKDAEAYPRYEAMLEKIAEFVEPILMMTPPDPMSNNIGDLFNMGKLGLKARGLKNEFYDKIRILSQSATEFLDRWFESDQLKATLATDGIIGAFAAPSTPGTAYVLLHHVMGETFGQKGVWAYVRGGMGEITQAMARSFQKHGGTILTNSPVEQIIVEDGKAVGVATQDGTEFRARLVASSADPKRTFLKMVDDKTLSDEFKREVRNIKDKSATFKLNLALSGVPNWKALPNIEGQAGAHHRGTMHISPSVQYIEDAHLDALAGRPSKNPVLECTMASVVDPSLTPKGKELMSIFVQYAPYQLKEGSWATEKDNFAKRCIDVIENYAPGFSKLVEDIHAISPQDLESEYHMTGGNIFHGEMSLDQLFFMRPIPQIARYRSPIDKLYMCGSSTHPGGGVLGACGHNAAREIIKDLRP